MAVIHDEAPGPFLFGPKRPLGSATRDPRMGTSRQKQCLVAHILGRVRADIHGQWAGFHSAVAASQEVGANEHLRQGQANRSFSCPTNNNVSNTNHGDARPIRLGARAAQAASGGIEQPGRFQQPSNAVLRTPEIRGAHRCPAPLSPTRGRGDPECVQEPPFPAWRIRARACQARRVRHDRTTSGQA